MRLVTHLMFAASLVFAFIFLQHHYGVRERFYQWWSGGTAHSNGSAAADSGWPASADHDYQIVIDVSGKNRFLTVVHGTDEAAKPTPKRHKKNSIKHPLPTKDQLQPVPQSTVQPTPSGAEAGVKSQ
jgi:hypothetical protein